MDSQAFRRGFLYGLAAAGHTPESYGELVLSKQASWGNLPDMAMATALGVPLIGGAMVGKGIYDLNKPDYASQVPDTRNQEVIRQMRLSTRRLNRRQRMMGVGTPQDASTGPLPV
jgi:hypothetical protein